MKNKYRIACAALGLSLLLSGCGTSRESVPESSAAVTPAPESSVRGAASAKPESQPKEASAAEGETRIDLSAGSASITQSGVYRVTGSLEEGTLTVNVDKATDSGLVHLIFDGIAIHSANGTPVHIVEAKDVQITLADNTTNTITQGAVQTTDESFPGAALFSKCDLVITGGGTLHITTEYNDGISGRDDLTIAGGTLLVTAQGDGLVGKDSLTVTGGDITITAGKDGLRSTNETESGKGALTVSAGSISINAREEGLEGIDVTVSGGKIDIVSGDDGINVKRNTGTLTISGGEIYLQSGGDGLDSNGSITQTGGTVVIDTTAIGPSDTPIDYDGTFTQTGGTIVDQNGNEISHTQMGMGRGGMFGPGGQPDMKPGARL